MNSAPIVRIITTTAIAWMLASAAHAQAPAGRSRAEVQAEEAAAAPDQNVVSGSRVNSKVVSTKPNAAQARAEARRNTPQ